MKRTAQSLLTVGITLSLLACHSGNNGLSASDSTAARALQPALQPQSELAASQKLSSDPPSRVARLAYSTGEVQFAPAGETRWGHARLNRPLVTGDRLRTGRHGRSALELGDSALRINDDSAVDLLNVDDRTEQIELSQGGLNMRVRQFDAGQNYEVDTPLVAFVAARPGDYRFDVAPDGRGTVVTLFDGSGTVYGENGARRVLESGHSYRFIDDQLDNASEDDLPLLDDFDRYSSTSDDRYSNSRSRRYVSADVIGYDDLDENGDWQETADYGEVWYPTNVSADWAPYRDGQWEWIEPYGWTWVDNAQWGFAPYHYGRWAQIENRWGWVPGDRDTRAVYAPALVGFVGGSSLSGPVDSIGEEPVGWFPLGPNDVYLPPYEVSRDYFNNVNTTNIRLVNNTVINDTVINNYYATYSAPDAATHIDYAYRAAPQAVTVVPRTVFTGAQPVAPAMLAVKPEELARADVLPVPHAVPSVESLGGNVNRLPAADATESVMRPVVAHTAPPPPPLPFSTRKKLIAEQGGTPVPLPRLRQLQSNAANSEPMPSHVRVIAANTPQFDRAGQPSAGTATQTVPAPAPVAMAPQPSMRTQPIPMHPGELPSARIAHPNAPAMMPATDEGGVADKAALQEPSAGAHAPGARFMGPAERRPGFDGGYAARQAPPAAEQARAAATGRITQIQAERGAAAEQERAMQIQAQRAAAQDQAAQASVQTQRMQAQRAAQVERAAQVQAERAAAQEHAAQAQGQAQQAAVRDRAMQLQRAAAQDQAAQTQIQTQHDAQQQRAAQMQAERAAAQDHAAQAQMQTQRAAQHERAAQMQAQQAAQEHAVQAQGDAQRVAQQERAAHLQAQRAAQQERVAQMQAQQVAAQEHAAQVQAEAQRAAQLERAAQQQAQRAAAQDQAAQAQVQAQRAAQLEAQSQRAAAQEHAAQAQMQAQRAAQQERAAQMQAQQAAAQEHAAQVQAEAQRAAQLERAAQQQAQRAAAQDQAAQAQVQAQRAAQLEAQSQRAAAQEHAAQAQMQAQRAAQQERAAQMQAQQAAAQEHAAQAQAEIQRVSQQERAAQLQVQVAAAQERAAQMQAQRAAVQPPQDHPAPPKRVPPPEAKKPKHQPLPPETDDTGTDPAQDPPIR